MSTETIAPASVATEADDKEAASLILKAGEMKLYSYHAPSLSAGDYILKVNHTISAQGNPDIKLNPTRKFRVKAPRFALPPDAIHSTYPNSGDGEEAKVLPHVVFDDAYLPWEREIEAKRTDFEQMPWLGVLTFRMDELKVTEGIRGLEKAQLASDMSYKMSLSDLWALRDSVSLPFSQEEMTKKQDKDRPKGEKSSDPVSAVLLKPDLFRKLFSSQEGNPTLSLERFKYMSHARIVQSEGMAGVGGGPTNTGAKEEFSVVVSPRSGPTHLLDRKADDKKPVPMVAHLISLEGFKNLSLPPPESNKLIGIPTLYSWSYNSLPPDSFDYDAAMGSLVKLAQPYRLTESVIKTVTDSIFNAPDNSEDDESKKEEQEVRKAHADWLQKRLESGYSFIKYCTATGDQTTALYRGPLSPVLDFKTEQISHASNQGSDLQIIDNLSGLADISYQVAWELGYAMGSSQKDFLESMLRLRNSITTKASAAYHAIGQDDRATPVPPAASKALAIGAIGKTAGADALQDPGHDTSMHKRWNKHHLVPDFSPGEKDPAQMDALIKDATESIIKGNVDPRDPTTGPSALTDWAFVSQWCIDRLMLTGFPAVYLHGDERYLPDEAMRTFYVDELWMNTFLDGALSIANHGSFAEKDTIRTELKRHLDLELQLDRKKPLQIPTWGVLLRSKVVQAFPDLRIKAPVKSEAARGARLEVSKMDSLADDTHLYLFDRKPEDGLFDPELGIIFSQPAHQQHFSVGDELFDDHLEMSYKLMPIATGQAGTISRKNIGGKVTWQRSPPSVTERPKEPIDLPNAIYDWDSQCLKFPAFADTCWKVPQALLPAGSFPLGQKTSSMTGLQLNDEPLSMQLLFPDIPAGNAYTVRRLPLPAPQAVKRKAPGITKSMIWGKKNDVFIAFPHPHILPKPLVPALQPSKPVISSFASGGPIPLTNDKKSSYLSKSLFPLQARDRNIPTASSHPLDLVFRMTAAPATPPDIVLTSLNIFIPAGTSSADLLRVTVADKGLLTMLPSARGLARGRRWLVVLKETHNPKVLARFKAVEGRKGVLPSAALVCSLRPRGNTRRVLKNGPDQSFLLEHVEVNGIEGKGAMVVEEEYERVASDKQTEKWTVSGVWGFEMERARLG